MTSIIVNGFNCFINSIEKVIAKAVHTEPRTIKYEKSEGVIVKNEVSKPPLNNTYKEIKPMPITISPWVIITEEFSLIKTPLIKVKKTAKMQKFIANNTIGL